MKGDLLTKSLFLFSLAGTVGFLVDVGTLYIVKEIFGNYWGRIISFFCAVLVTWLINRRHAFSHRVSGMSLFGEFSRYLSVMLGGGIVNYFVYAVLVFAVNAIENQPIWGVAVGSIAGMYVNYISAKHFVFTHTKVSGKVN